MKHSDSILFKIFTGGGLYITFHWLYLVLHRVREQGQGTIASNVVRYLELWPTPEILATPTFQRFVCYWTHCTHDIKSAWWCWWNLCCHVVPSYTGKNITHFLPLALWLVRNNTGGNKLVLFSGIALYYGDTYILQIMAIASSPGPVWPEQFS